MADRHSPISARNEEVGVVRYREDGAAADADADEKNSVVRLV